MQQFEKVIRIPKELFQSVVEQCQQALPYESCGFLSGNVEGEITSNWYLKNEAKSKSQFLVSRATVGETLRKIDAKKEAVFILYHSHPTTPPMPSRHDLQYHPDEHVRMLIISLMDGQSSCKCFKITGNHYIEVPIQLF